MRWFAIDIAIFEFRLAVWWAWTVRKRCQSLWARPGSPPSWGSKLRTDSQIDNFLIWFDGVTECDWLFSCSFYGLIGFIGLWGVFGWSILHLAIQLLKNRHRLMVTVRRSDCPTIDCFKILLSDDNLAIKNRMWNPRRSFCGILFYNIFVLFLPFS